MSTREYLPADVVEALYGFERTLTEEHFDEYQRWMTRLLVENEAVMLGAFMGSGKTACALKAAHTLWRAGSVKKWLIVAPKNVAADTWPDELMVWDFAREFEYSVIVGSVEQREAAVAADADVYIINRENYRWLVEHLTLRRWKFDGLIYDEASRLKAGSLKTKPTIRKDGTESTPRKSELGFLMHTRSRFSRVWELSGTPATNGIIDLWGPMYLLDHGERLGRTKNRFLNRWFGYNQWTKTWKPHEHSEEEVIELLDDVLFCLREEDYIDLPPLVIRDRYVRLDPAHMKKYREFERTLYLEDYDVEAVNNGVLVNKLLQMANGSVYASEDDDLAAPGKPVAKHVHDRKLDELGSIFEEAAGRPVLVAYSYKFDVHAIKKRFPWVRVYGETPRDLADWNNGKLRALVLHPASAGHGMNFQRGGSIAVWYGLNWSLELYQQFNKRLHRRGQEAEQVWLYRILARDTRDVQVAELLGERGVTQDRIVARVRVHADRIRRDLGAVV